MMALLATTALAAPRNDWRVEPHRHRIVEEPAEGGTALLLHGLKIYKGDRRDFDHSVPMTFSFPLSKGAAAVQLTFLSSAPRYEFQEEHQLVLELDGERIEPGPATYSGRTICVTVQEKVSSSLSLADLERLTSAREVRGRLGPFSFNLDDGHLRVMADYLRRCREGR